MATLTVSPADLTAAFKAAKPGDELTVTPGTLQKWRPGAPIWDATTNPVVITAADPASPPVFAGGVTMDGWRGVTWRGVAFDIRNGGYGHSAACLAAGAANAAIGFERSTFVGLSDPATDVNGAPELGGIGYGISGKFKGLRIIGNIFRDMPKAIVLADSEDVDILDNDMFDITTDNIVFSGLQRARILRNLLGKKALPAASGAHPDHIQGTKSVTGRPSTDILIADNLMHSPPDGKESQGAHLDDDPGYVRVVVRDNLLLNTIYRSLSCIEGADVAFLNNLATTSRAKTMAGSEAYSGLYYKGAAECSGNSVNRVQYGPAETQRIVPLATVAEIEALRADWLAKFRAVAPEPAPEPIDPHLAEIAELQALLTAANTRIDRLLADRAAALDLAKKARAARAKNQYLDPLITLLSTPV